MHTWTIWSSLFCSLAKYVCLDPNASQCLAFQWVWAAAFLGPLANAGPNTYIIQDSLGICWPPCMTRALRILRTPPHPLLRTPVCRGQRALPW